MHIGSRGTDEIGNTRLAKNSVSIQLLDTAEALELVNFDLGVIPRMPETCLN